MNKHDTPPKNFTPTPFEYHQTVELEIDDLNNLGTGVGRIDGWVVMVPFALGGERVKARIYKNHKNFSEGDLLEVVRPSPDRVAPFAGCSGFAAAANISICRIPRNLNGSGNRLKI